MPYHLACLRVPLPGVAELATVIGERSVEAVLHVEVNDTEAVRAALRQAFTALMRCDTTVIMEQVTNLVSRLQIGEGLPQCKYIIISIIYSIILFYCIFYISTTL